MANNMSSYILSLLLFICINSAQCTVNEGVAITGMSPTTGSIGGGTVVTIYGTNLPTDGDTEIVVKFFLFNKLYETDLFPNGCTATQITFTTRNNLNPALNHRVWLEINGEYVNSICEECRFVPMSEQTPIIRDVQPRMQMKGRTIVASGKILTAFTDSTTPSFDDTRGVNLKITRTMAGADLCDMYDEAGVSYGTALYDPAGQDGYITCEIRSGNVGCLGHFKMIIQEWGRSIIDDAALWLSYTGEICSIQIIAGIDSVDVQSGGTMGGTRITLTGTNLDASADYPLEVYIGEQRAVVEFVDEEKLVILSPPAPETTPSASAGEPGILLSRGLGARRGDMPDALTEISWSESFGVRIRDEFGVGTQSAFFLPPDDGDYTFYVMSVCLVQLYISYNEDEPTDSATSMDPSAKRLIVDISTNVHHLDLENGPNSGPLRLFAGQKYYLEMAFRCNNNSMITVKVHKHASTVNNKDYPGGIDEVQQIAISSTEQNMQQTLNLAPFNYNTQSYKVSVTVEANTAENTFYLCFSQACTTPLFAGSSAEIVQTEIGHVATVPTGSVSVSKSGDVYVLEFGGGLGPFVDVSCHGPCSAEVTRAGRPNRQNIVLSVGGDRISAPISREVTPAELSDAIRGAMSVPCPSIITDSGNVFYMTSFEEETTRESEGIRSRDRVGAFCGEKVLYRPNYVYEQREGSDTPSVIPMAQYPYLCMAYKGAFRTVIISYKTSRNGPALRRGFGVNFSTFPGWHYTCANILEQMTNLHRSNNDFYVSTIQIQANLDINEGEAFLDQFSVRKFDVFRTRESALPQLTERDIVNTRVMPRYRLQELGVESTGRFTFIIDAKPYDCQEMDLISVKNDPQNKAQTRIEQEGSGPITGSFNVLWNGNAINNIDASIAAVGMASTLSFNSTFGDVSVVRSGTCAGYTYQVTFQSVPGDLELMQVESNLIGTNVAVEVSKVTRGGLVTDIYADATAKVFEQPQIRARVNGLGVKCDDCSFSYSEDLTPTVSSISATEGTYGTRFEVVMTGADEENPERNHVLIGGEPCEIIRVTPTSLKVAVGVTPSGTHPVVVRVDGKGDARMAEEFTFTVAPSVQGMSPNTGSMGGGYELTVTGGGFQLDSEIIIDGSTACPTVGSPTFGQIICTMPALRQGRRNIGVMVDGEILQLRAAFVIRAGPFIDELSITRARAEGGEILQIRGRRFGNQWLTSTPSTVGGVIAGKREHTNTMVELILPPLPPGPQEVALIIEGEGRAVQRDGTLPTIEVIFEADGVHPEMCSTYGGCPITISGSGLLMEEPENFDITVDGAPCEFDTDAPYTDTELTCFLGDTSAVHQIKNHGFDPDLGEGFQYDFPLMDIFVNDVVVWSWKAPRHFHNAVFGVYQVPNEYSNYDGDEELIHSPGPPSTEGQFVRRFLEPGFYHFESGVVHSSNGHRLRCIVLVSERFPSPGVISLAINGVEAAIAPESRRRRRSPSSCSPRAGCDAVPASGGNIGVSLLPCLGGIIDDISPTYGTSSTMITITGRNFNSDPDCLHPTIGDYPCIIQGGVNEDGLTSSFECTLDSTPEGAEPMAANDHYPVNVGQGEYGWSLINNIENTKRHYYFKASIHDIQPRVGSIGGGTEIVITGEGFVAGVTETTVDGFACTISSVTYDEITCTTTSRPGDGDGPVEVVVDGVAARCEPNSDACNFESTYDATPTTISALPPLHSGNSVVTISGTKFGDDASIVEVNIGGAPCENRLVSDEVIECYLANGPVGRLNFVRVKVGNLGYASGDSTTLNIIPQLTSLSPSSGSTEGGALLTIEGNGFIEGDVTVEIATDVYCVIESTTYSTVTCRTPASVAGSHNLVIFSGGTRYNRGPETLTFEYSSLQTPVVTAISPGEGAPGTDITITGVGFEVGSTVTIGDAECIQDPSAVGSSEEIICSAGEHAAGVFGVNINIHSKGLATSAETFHYSLSVESVSPERISLGGNIEITLTGSGFGGERMSIAVCGIPCTDIISTSTEATCRAPTIDQSTGETECLVTVSSGAEHDSVIITYAENVTPIISNVNPRRGGTGGGTDVTVTGVNFGFDASVVSVAIGGEDCAILSMADTQIICDTSSRPTSINTEVVVLIRGQGQSIEAAPRAAYFQYSNVWSSRFTWGRSGILPRDKDMILVPNDQSLVVDLNTPLIKMLLIQGGEVTFDNADVTLKCENILLTGGGIFRIGTEDEPFQHQAVIEMYGHLRAPEIPIFGAKTLGVQDGLVDFHGKHIAHTWTLLAQTAEAGATVLFLQDCVSDWNVGDTIAIASTGDLNSQKENEDHVIVDVSEDGMSITLETPLEYEHLGITLPYGDNQSFDMRAEVLLLTRNIRFMGMGDPAWEVPIPACPRDFDTGQFAINTCSQGRFGAEMGSSMFGAAIMASNPLMDSQKAVIRMSYVELYFVGQAYRIGRYPVHFHMNGDSSQSYLIGISIHKTFNRAINIHNSHNILISGVVIYNAMGGAIFFEDSIETGNTVEYTVLVFVRSSSSLRTDDITPAGMWITHPDNIIRHNHVAGGTHFGFWYRMLEHPEGPSHTLDICPQNANLGEFYNNTVHSVGWYGLWIFEDYFPKQGGYCGSTVDEPAVFRNLTTWNSLRGGECAVCGAVHFEGFKCANMDKSCIEWLHVTDVVKGQFRPRQGPAVIDAHIISHLEGFPCTRLGLVLPFDSGLTIDGVTFYNFNGAERDDGHVCSGIGLVKIACQCSHPCGGMRYEFQNVAYYDTNHITHPEWKHEWILVDRDGSFTGTVPGAKVLPASGMYNSEWCVEDERFFGTIPSVVCGPEAKFARLAINEIEPSDHLERSDLLVENAYGSDIVYFHYQGITHRFGWYMILPTQGVMNHLSWPSCPAVADIGYSAGIYDMEAGDYLMITHDVPRLPSFNSLVIGGALSLPVSEPLTENSNTGDWYLGQDGDTYSYSYIISDKVRDRDFGNREWHYVMEGNSCTDMTLCEFEMPTDAEDQGVDMTVQRLQTEWDDESIWQTASGPQWFNAEGEQPAGLPTEGAHIIIPEAIHMFLDQESLPRFEKIDVLGILEVDNDAEKSYTLDVTYLYISGQFIAGTERQEFAGSLTINLHGDVSTPEYVIIDPPNSDGINMGAKAIGNYGDLRLFGLSHDCTWTKLSQTAEAGSRYLQLSEEVDWAPGSEIVLTPTSYNTREVERNVIETVTNNGRTLYLAQELLYKHLSESENLPTGHSYANRAEVGLLTRNIKIQAVAESEDYYGGRLLNGMRTIADGDGFYTTYRGTAAISNVEFNHMGQRGYTEEDDPRFALAFVSTREADADRPAFVVDCSFHDSYSSNLGVYDAEGVAIENNVFADSYKTSVIWTGTQIFRGNLVTGVETSGDKDFHAAVQLQFANRNSVVRDNVVAGVQRTAFDITGESCPHSPTYKPEGWDNNEIRSAMWGIIVWRQTCSYGIEHCALIRGFKISRVTNMGVYYDDACNLKVTNMTFVDNSLGLVAFVGKPNILLNQFEDKTVHFDNSLLVGNSPWMDCRVDRVEWTSRDMLQTGNGRPFFHERIRIDGALYGFGKTGFVTPSFVSKSILAPGKTFLLTKAYPATHGLTTATNLTAAHWDIGCGGVKDTVISTNPMSLDLEHPLDISHFTGIDTPRESLLHIGEPNINFITAGSCGNMECDAEKKYLVHDLDGSFTGSDGSVHIIPQSERNWDVPGQEVRGIGDFRIPGVMQTDLEGNRIPMDIVRPHLGIDRPENALFVPAFPGYIVSGRSYALVVFESLDVEEFLTRRFFPMVIRSSRGYTDQVDGFRGYTLCEGYPCNHRPGVGVAICAIGEEYDVFFTSDPPAKMRIHLLNVQRRDAIRFNIYYGNRQRMDVYNMEHQYIPPMNGRMNNDGLLYVRPPQNDPMYFHNIYKMCPTRHGMNVYDMASRTLSVTVKGEPLEIRQTEVSVLELGVEMSAESDFFDEDLIVRLAAALNVPLSNIRVVEVINENDVRRRRRNVADHLTMLAVEIGAAPTAVLNDTTSYSSTSSSSDDDDNSMGSSTETGSQVLVRAMSLLERMVADGTLASTLNIAAVYDLHVVNTHVDGQPTTADDDLEHVETCASGDDITIECPEEHSIRIKNVQWTQADNSTCTHPDGTCKASYSHRLLTTDCNMHQSCSFSEALDHLGHIPCASNSCLKASYKCEAFRYSLLGPKISPAVTGTLDTVNQTIVIADVNDTVQIDGAVIGYKVVTQTTNTVVISFWNPTPSGLRFVGGTRFEPCSEGYHTVLVSSDDEVLVEKGYVMGVSWKDGPAIERYTTDCAADQATMLRMDGDHELSSDDVTEFSATEVCGRYAVQAMISPLA